MREVHEGGAPHAHSTATPSIVDMDGMACYGGGRVTTAWLIGRRTWCTHACLLGTKAMHKAYMHSWHCTHLTNTKYSNELLSVSEASTTPRCTPKLPSGVLLSSRCGTLNLHHQAAINDDHSDGMGGTGAGGGAVGVHLLLPQESAVRIVGGILYKHSIPQQQDNMQLILVYARAALPVYSLILDHLRRLNSTDKVLVLLFVAVIGAVLLLGLNTWSLFF